MPTTSDDARLIRSMPPGTRVRHFKMGTGTVKDVPPEYGQIPVVFDSMPLAGVFCDPANLEKL